MGNYGVFFFARLLPEDNDAGKDVSCRKVSFHSGTQLFSGADCPSLATWRRCPSLPTACPDMQPKCVSRTVPPDDVTVNQMVK